jgi:hypothetical protein
LGAVAFLVYQRKLRRAKAIERGLKMVPVLIHLPPASSDTTAGGRDVREVIREKTAQAEVLYNLIAGTAVEGFKSSFYGQRHVALELVAADNIVHFYAAIPVNLVSTIEKAIQTAYPGARMEEVEDHNIFNQEGRLAATMGGEMVLKADASYPIATYALLERDPMEALMTALSTLAKADGAAIQIMLRPANPSWVKHSTALTTRLRKGRASSMKVSAVDLAKAAYKSPTTQRAEDRERQPESVQLSNLELSTVEAIEEKTKNPGFEVLIRVLVSTESVARSQSLLRDLATTFALFDRPGLNGFKFLPAVDVQGLVTAFIFRFFPPQMKTNILNTEELATLFHLPDSQFTPTTNVTRQQSKQVDGPVQLPQEGLLFGYNEFRGVRKEIRLSPEDRRRHTYILGQTGTGKSTLLENLAVQDMLAGNGFAFIDPHGDTAEKLLAMVPKNRAEDVVYFNPADTEYPLGLNLFEFTDPTQKDFLIQETIGMLYKLYDPGHTGIIGPRYEHWYRNAALTLMSDPAGSTFIEIPKVFTDTDYLKHKFKYLKDPTVIDFWVKEMGQTSDYHKSEMLGWFVSKFGAFQNNEMMRNIIGQTKSSFNIRDIMDNKKILIVNLSKGRIGDLNSQLLGMIFVIKFQAAAMSRADVPEDQRPDFSLYVDEFQNFATDSFASILSEARKYHLNLIVANQFIAQLSPEIRDAVFGNIGTIAAHRMGPDDAEFMVKQFAPVFDVSDMVNLPNYNAVMRLMMGGLPSQPFSVHNLPPLGTANPELGIAMKQLSAAKFGQAKAVVEADIVTRMTGKIGAAPVAAPAPAPAPAPVAAPVAAEPTPAAPAPAPVPASPATQVFMPEPAAAAPVATPAPAPVAVPMPAAPTPAPVAVSTPVAAAPAALGGVGAPPPIGAPPIDLPAVVAAPAPILAPTPVSTPASMPAPAPVPVVAASAALDAVAAAPSAPAPAMAQTPPPIGAPPVAGLEPVIATPVVPTVAPIPPVAGPPGTLSIGDITGGRPVAPTASVMTEPLSPEAEALANVSLVPAGSEPVVVQPTAPVVAAVAPAPVAPQMPEYDPSLDPLADVPLVAAAPVLPSQPEPVPVAPTPAPAPAVPQPVVASPVIEAVAPAPVPAVPVPVAPTPAPVPMPEPEPARFAPIVPVQPVAAPVEPEPVTPAPQPVSIPAAAPVPSAPAAASVPVEELPKADSLGDGSLIHFVDPSLENVLERSIEDLDQSPASAVTPPAAIVPPAAVTPLQTPVLPAAPAIAPTPPAPTIAELTSQAAAALAPLMPPAASVVAAPPTPVVVAPVSVPVVAPTPTPAPAPVSTPAAPAPATAVSLAQTPPPIGAPPVELPTIAALAQSELKPVVQPQPVVQPLPAPVEPPKPTVEVSTKVPELKPAVQTEVKKPVVEPIAETKPAPKVEPKVEPKPQPKPMASEIAPARDSELMDDDKLTGISSVADMLELDHDKVVAAGASEVEKPAEPAVAKTPDKIEKPAEPVQPKPKVEADDAAPAKVMPSTIFKPQPKPKTEEIVAKTEEKIDEVLSAPLIRPSSRRHRLPDPAEAGQSASASALGDDGPSRHWLASTSHPAGTTPGHDEGSDKEIIAVHKVIQPEEPKVEAPVAAPTPAPEPTPEPTPAPTPVSQPEPEPEMTMPVAVSLDATDVAEAKAKAAKEAQAAPPAPTEEPKVAPARHRLGHAEAKPAKSESKPEPKPEPKDEAPTKTEAKPTHGDSAPQPGKLIMPSQKAKSDEPKAAPSPVAKPAKLAKGEIYVDESGNVQIGE